MPVNSVRLLTVYEYSKWQKRNTRLTSYEMIDSEVVFMVLLDTDQLLYI